MEKRGLSQEALKTIACITMLLDHIGAIFVRGDFTLRIIGRIAFPIFCFLLVEGAYYTKNPKKYALRLAIGMLLSEIPFDIALEKKWVDWTHQSVMVTLLLGYIAIELIRRTDSGLLKLAITGAGFHLAEQLCTDYGGHGVLLIILFSQCRGQVWMQGLMLLGVSYLMNSLKIPFYGRRVPIELFAVFAMVPIGLYSGRKLTHAKAVQWGFYLFYPVHLIVLWLIYIFR